MPSEFRALYATARRMYQVLTDNIAGLRAGGGGAPDPLLEATFIFLTSFTRRMGRILLEAAEREEAIEQAMQTHQTPMVTQSTPLSLPFEDRVDELVRLMRIPLNGPDMVAIRQAYEVVPLIPNNVRDPRHPLARRARTLLGIWHMAFEEDPNISELTTSVTRALILAGFPVPHDGSDIIHNP